MITEKISNGGILSGTINASSNLTMGIGSSNNLVGGNINTFTKEIDPTIPDYIKAISKEDIAGWDNNAVVNEEQNKTLMRLEELIDIITPKNTVKGELVHITDALGLPTFENKVDGNVEQETTKGTNEFNAYAIANANIVVSEEGKKITLPIATDNGYMDTKSTLKELCPNIKVGDIVYLYFSRNLTADKNKFIYLREQNTFWSVNNSRTITQNDLDSSVIIYGNRAVDGETEQCILTDFQITKVKDAPWEEYSGGQASPNPDYPQEIEVLEAYNLLKITTFTDGSKEQTKNGVTATINDDGTITCKGTATDAIIFYLTKNDLDFTLGDGYFLCNSPSANQRLEFMCSTDGADRYLNSYGSGNFINAKTSFVFKMAYISIAKGEEVDVTFTPMFAKGTTQKPYLPYGCVGYKVIGNNFCKTTDCNISDTNYSCIIQNGEIKINSTNINNNFDICGGVRTGEWIQGYEKATDYFLTPKGGTYAIKLFIDEISGSGSGSNQLVIHTNKQKIIRYFSTTSTDITAKISLENDEYIKQVAIWTNSTLIIKIKGKVLLEQDLITSWEPYQEQIVYLDLKGNWVGAINDNIKDYLVTDKKKYWLVKNVGKVVLDGSENWISDETNRFYIVKNALIDKGIITQAPSIIYSNRFIYKETAWSGKGTMGISVSGALWCVMTDNFSITSALDFKTWLSNNNVELYYQLAKPEIIELGKLPEPIKTFEGTNNIQLLANLDTEIEVKYALDVKKYADDRYFELTNALISTGANL